MVRDAGGTVIPDADLLFTPTVPTVATVDAAGMLTPLTAGGTLFTVTSPDATGSGTFRLNVIPAGSVDAFAVNPTTATIAVAGTVDLGINAQADGDEISNFLGVFTSSDPTIATVNPFTGVVTGVAPGLATITVVNGALTSEAEVTVQ